MSNYSQFDIEEPQNQRQSDIGQMIQKILDSIMRFLALFRSHSIKVNERNLTSIAQIGEGGFSFVHLVSDSSGTKYALKSIRIQLPEHECRLRKEIEAHKKVSSPYILVFEAYLETH
jgi:serine/threonine protein kinase